jgi:putative membrane protein
MTRTLLAVSAAALALGGCNTRTENTAATDTTIVADDSMTANESLSNAMLAQNGMADAGTVSTPEFVRKAAISDMYEVEASRIAAKSATSAGLKKFANEMVAAHTATTAAMKTALKSGSVNETPPAEMDAEHKALIQALDGAKGEAFDALYKSQQLEAHTKALALMQGYAATGDNGALKAFASDTAPKVQSHLDMLGTM